MPVLGNSEPFVKIHLPLHREWRGWDCMELEGASSCIQSQPSSDSNCMRDPRKASRGTVQLSLGNPQNCEREQHGGYLNPLNFGVICSALVGDQNNEEARSFNWEAENLLFFFFESQWPLISRRNNTNQILSELSKGLGLASQETWSKGWSHLCYLWKG